MNANILSLVDLNRQNDHLNRSTVLTYGPSLRCRRVLFLIADIIFCNVLQCISHISIRNCENKYGIIWVTFE